MSVVERKSEPEPNLPSKKESKMPQEDQMTRKLSKNELKTKIIKKISKSWDKNNSNKSK